MQSKTIAGVALSLLLAACSHTDNPNISQQALENKISQDSVEKFGPPAPDTVQCPGSLSATTGASITCQLTAGSVHRPANVRITGISQGQAQLDVDFPPIPEMPAKLAADIKKAAMAKYGNKVVDVQCPENLRVDIGVTNRCVISGDDGQRYGVSATYTKDADGSGISLSADIDPMPIAAPGQPPASPFLDRQFVETSLAGILTKTFAQPLAGSVHCPGELARTAGASTTCQVMFSAGPVRNVVFSISTIVGSTISFHAELAPSADAPSELAAELKRVANEKFGDQAASVACPFDTPLFLGGHFQCAVTANDGSAHVISGTIVERSPDAPMSYEYDISPPFSANRTAAEVQQQVSAVSSVPRFGTAPAMPAQTRNNVESQRPALPLGQAGPPGTRLSSGQVGPNCMSPLWQQGFHATSVQCPLYLRTRPGAMEQCTATDASGTQRQLTVTFLNWDAATKRGSIDCTLNP